MKLLRWDELPQNMRNEQVKEYYDILEKKRMGLIAKRIFDLVFALFLCTLLAPLFLIVSIAIKINSPGNIIFKQTRVTQYGRRFLIYKFRTMVDNAESIGFPLTTLDDSRVTSIGKFLRKYRIDEIPQLLNIIKGEMSFVGTRPEVVKYVERYTDEMMATLLLPAGVTSEACLIYKNEEQILSGADDPEDVYMNFVLPDKMKLNLESIKRFGFLSDFRIIFKTGFAVLAKDEEDQKKKDRVGIEKI